MTARRRVVVVGAGPAGCSTAIHLAEAGLDVVLIDQARFPRAKPCGEGVMPRGVEELKALGVYEEAAAAGWPYVGVRFENLSGRSAQGSFRGGKTGLVIRREILDDILLRRAKRCVGLEVIESCRAAGPKFRKGRISGMDAISPYGQPMAIFADFAVVADGATSDTARRLRVSRRMPKRRRHGFRMHFSGVDPGDRVEVTLLDGGEAYVAPQPRGEALVSLLVEEHALARFAGRTKEAFQEMLFSAPALKSKFEGAARASEIIGAGPLGGRAERWEGPGWLLAGDAASSVDPITGEGISLALLNGRLAAEQVVSGKDGDGYARRRAALVRKKSRLAAYLLSVNQRPFAAACALGVLGAVPFLFDSLLSD
ncbi:MAG: NAD(P)/FAD-dependent oxidoreductase [Elusimicrobia bacterium]|nr:NAD(P)/FAD-dependent oxidoreductase [Elusimicrobiota bacterium]